MGVLKIGKLTCLVCAFLTPLYPSGVFGIKASGDSNISPFAGKSVGNLGDDSTLFEPEETLKLWLTCVTPLVGIFRQRRHTRMFEWNYDDWRFDRVPGWPSETKQRQYDDHETIQQDDYTDNNDQIRLEDLHQMPTEAPASNNSAQVVDTPEPEIGQPTTRPTSTKKPYTRQPTYTRQPNYTRQPTYTKKPARESLPPRERRPSRPPLPPRKYIKHRQRPYPSSQLLDDPYVDMAAIAHMLQERENQVRNRDYYYRDDVNGEQGCADGQCSESVLPLVALSGIGLLLLYLVAVAPVSSGKRKKRSSSLEDMEGVDGAMDTATWVSILDGIWNAADESDPFDDATLKALRRMNRLALHSPQPARQIILLSGIPLSYLLHERNNNRGFTCYLSAALTGHYETDCTTGPSRLQIP